MFKLISCIVAGAIVLAPLLPAQAGYRTRSSGFGVTIGSPSSFGVPSGFSGGTFYRGSPGYNRQIIIRTPSNGYYNNGYYNNGYYSPGFYPPAFPGSTVIVAPRARRVIVNPGFGFGNYTLPSCGTAIYGSPIPSPIPVNPYTGLACR
ncbi:hypothetical protein [Leptolyngbya sp. FACHB-17]|uniref:hypothetical protein n=1 Tax=unclassified Leptolyngbya TaxID=2650499 RepID=UPI00168189A2|nr:hypothetical protein [Leptolyngbya sp. FACHB-17]MBD2079019.1 hypothetical protein [Leptolyngbya sp. FACHB-17]